jgi:hypothetical protein
MIQKLKSYKWLLAVLLVLLVWMVYADLSGWRLFTWGSDSSWSAGGPGYHK